MSVKEKMTAIASAIREKTGTTEKLGLDAMAAAIPQVYNAGGQDQYDAFWDLYQQNGNRRCYYYAFAQQQIDGEGWATDAYNPKYPIIADGADNAQATQNIFTYSYYIRDTKVPITLKNGSAQADFYRCRNMVRIPSLTLENVTDFTNTFRDCNALETLIIHGTIGVGGLNLQWSTKLSKESLESIIDALSTTTSGLSITLSSAAVTAAFGSTAADEWTTRISTRSNWTISLV